MSRLYHEIHITVAAKAPETWDGFAQHSRDHFWRASKFDVDDVDAMDGQWFMSAREKSLEVAKDRTRQMLTVLRLANYDILRWKIEDTILDSKHGDTENDLR